MQEHNFAEEPQFHTNRAYEQSSVKPLKHGHNIRSEERRSSTHQRRHPGKATMRYTPVKQTSGVRKTANITLDSSQGVKKANKYTIVDRRKKNYSLVSNPMHQNLNFSLNDQSDFNEKQMHVSPRLREENSMLNQSKTSFNV